MYLSDGVFYSLDFKTVEHLLRHGHKQKKLIEMPGFTSAATVVPASSKREE
jgi:hypothetical protein